MATNSPLITDVDVIVFNTVLWANVIASGDGRVSGSGPRIMWILHEMEITEHSVPRHEKLQLRGNQPVS